MRKLMLTGLVLLVSGALALAGNRAAQNVFGAQWGGPNFAAGLVNIGSGALVVIGLCLIIIDVITRRTT